MTATLKTLPPVPYACTSPHSLPLPVPSFSSPSPLSLLPQWMLENDITDVVDLTLTAEQDYFGRKEVIELKPGGKDIQVTNQNVVEYVSLVRGTCIACRGVGGGRRVRQRGESDMRAGMWGA